MKEENQPLYLKYCNGTNIWFPKSDGEFKIS